MESMDLDEAYDRIEELEFTLQGQELIDALGAEAEALPVGALGRAAFLNVQGEFLATDGQLDMARRSYEAAVADGGPTIIHPLAGLLEVALKARDEAEADAALDQLKVASRNDLLPFYTYEHVGEDLEAAERYREALRWYNIPLRDADPDDPDPALIGVLNGHFRVRRILDLPRDRFDEASEVLRTHYQRRV